MAKRTYAPQMARMLQRVVVYFGKHGTSINQVATPQQWTDLQTIAQAINNSWAAVQTKEQP